MHLFGLTGGIASGKSTVAARLRERGLPVIDADALARDVVEKGTPGIAEIVETFGGDVLFEDGTLDRKKLAAVVFGDDQKRRTLNAIVHPKITALSLERADALRAQGHPLACYEAALLVENGVADAFRPLVVVAADESVQLARGRARDGANEEEIRGRIRAQMPLAKKIAVADFVIHNDGTRGELLAKTDDVLDAICAKLGVDAARYPR
ncbi:Dephospho-CoA kinase [Labilithrix luteola]|uniref:Dephospho-CoA kinase n=1 Tax=Labilithrix luteola TaxID=1391654 RepID=A0A0K1Q7T7_9BACT|nr:dephospho-CoA kinase [Labilithrix luteola]AKV01784.1 Dephospho-CoA kinase [Labilithrix luteola]